MSKNASNPPLSRRQLLAGGAALAAAGFASATSPRSPIAHVQVEEKDYAKIFKDTLLIDHNGKPFDPKAAFENKTVLIAFGYGGCPLCEEINKTLAATQKELTKAGHDVPILVISVQPENERKTEGQLEDTVKKFTTLGLRSKSGAFTFALPKNAEAAQKLQKELAGIAGTPTGTEARAPKQHSRFITLMQDGQVIKPVNGPFIGADLDPVEEQFFASAELVEKQSKRILDTVNALSAAKEQNSPRR